MKNRLCICIIFFLVFFGCTKEKEKPGVAAPTAVKDVASITTVLATIADGEKPQAAVAVMGHAKGTDSFKVLFSESGRSAAYIAEKDGKAYVVHNGEPGKHYATIGEVVLSPDGKRIAYGAVIDGKWRMVTDGLEGSSFDSVAPPAFSSDSKHVAYKAMQGEMWFIVVDNTANAGTKANYARREFNADSNLIAFIEMGDEKNKGRLVVSDLGFKDQTVLDGIGSLMITNDDRTRIAAVSVENGKQRVIELSFSSPKNVKKGQLYDSVNNLVFGPDGVSLAYEAQRAGEHFVVFNGKEERISKKPLIGPPVIRPDLKAVGAIIADTNPATQHKAIDPAGNHAGLQEFFVKDARKGKEFEEAAHLAYSSDGSAHAYVARTGQNWFVVVNGKEGPVFDRVVSPVFSPDGKKLVYRARKDGKRFVVVADPDGKTIKQHPAYEQVFQPVFAVDGKSVAYGVKDGNKLIWKVEAL